MIRLALSITLPGFAAGALMMALGSRHVGAAVRRERWTKFGVYFVIVHLFVGAAAAGRWWMLSLVGAIAAAGAVEVGRAAPRMTRGSPALAEATYALLGATLVANAWQLAPAQVLFLYLVVAFDDGFSQVSGQLFGRRRLAPRISPGKTVEGLACGLAGAAAVAVLLRPLAGVGPTAALGLGLAVGLAGLAGDLSASWIKRSAGIKDYSSALPGHGGFLDRFDSFVAAGAAAGALLRALG